MQKKAIDKAVASDDYSAQETDMNRTDALTELETKLKRRGYKVRSKGFSLTVRLSLFCSVRIL